MVKERRTSKEDSICSTRIRASLPDSWLGDLTGGLEVVTLAGGRLASIGSVVLRQLLRTAVVSIAVITTGVWKMKTMIKARRRWRWEAREKPR